MNRKKKLKIIQLSLLFASLLVLYFSYSQKFISTEKILVSKEIQNKIDEELSKGNQESDTFFNVSYSSIDLSGNRYILNAKKAKNNRENIEIIFMNEVDAIFYFKDDTILKVQADEAKYNNKTLDIIFKNNVKAYYEESELFAEKAEFSNSKSFLIITEDVKVYDKKGKLFADKLFFDLEKNTLKIVAFEKNKINANIELEWKKDLEF